MPTTRNNTDRTKKRNNIQQNLNLKAKRTKRRLTKIHKEVKKAKHPTNPNRRHLPEAARVPTKPAKTEKRARTRARKERTAR